MESSDTGDRAMSSSVRPADAPRLSALSLVAAFAAYSAVAVLLTWPLLPHLASALPHDAEDPLLSATILWWNSHVLPLSASWLNGFFFYPAGGALALSDHRLGLMPLASPLLWSGLDIVTTYNLVFLATYPLCATMAHALAFTLTKRHDASAICGLAFGFNPFRVEHLPHLELLAAYGMPAGLAALHRYRESGRPAWAAAFAAALVLQGFSASYYFMFFLVLVAAWIAWFMRPREWRQVAWILGACAAAGLLLLPAGLEFLRIHRAFGLSRGAGEVRAFSADVTSIVTAPSLLKIWGWTSTLNTNENRTFVGLTIVLLAGAGVIATLARPVQGTRRLPALISATLLTVSAGCLVIAALTGVLGPWRIALGPLVVSGTVIYKPLSVAAAALAILVMLSGRFRDAYNRRSAFAFYLFATCLLSLLSLGPTPAFLGRQVLYQPPYAWLMRLPIFDQEIRAPARFAMLAALTLSVAAALAYARLTSPGSARARVAAAVVVAGILGDTWVGGVPLAPVPPTWNPTHAEGFAGVLELPLGGTGDDVAAMYRAVSHRHSAVNGYSGYSPTHYRVLRAGLDERDDSVLDAIAVGGPLLLVADKTKDGNWASFARTHPGTAPLDEDDHWAFFSLPQSARPPQSCGAPSVPIVGATDNHGGIAVATITDNNPLTWWSSGDRQLTGDQLVLDLGQVSRPCAVVLSQAGFVMGYPRYLSVAVSVDGKEWSTPFSGATSGLMVQASLTSPVNPQLGIGLPSGSARFVRLRIERTVESGGWILTDVAVKGLP
jgi:hypothetical protein